MPSSRVWVSDMGQRVMFRRVSQSVLAIGLGGACIRVGSRSGSELSLVVARVIARFRVVHGLLT